MLGCMGWGRGGGGASFSGLPPFLKFMQPKSRSVDQTFLKEDIRFLQFSRKNNNYKIS